MNDSLQEDWNPHSYKGQWIAIGIVVAILIGAYNLVMESEVSSTKDAIVLLSTHTDIVAGYKPSEQRSAFLTHVKKITAQKSITLRDISRAESLFNDAEEAETDYHNKISKAALAKSVDAAL